MCIRKQLFSVLIKNQTLKRWVDTLGMDSSVLFCVILSYVDAP